MAEAKTHTTTKRSDTGLIWTFLLIFIIAFGYIYFVIGWYETTLPDFLVYHEASKRLFSDQPLYGIATNVDDNGHKLSLYYLYPPPLTVFVSILGDNEQEAAFAWLSLLYIFSVLGAFLLAIIISERTRFSFFVTATFVLLLLFFFEPFRLSLSYGQINPVIFTLEVSYLWLVQKGKERSAGFSLALATWLKITPAILILAPLLLRRWGVVAAFSISILAIGLSSLWGPLGVEDYKNFVLHAGASGVSLGETFADNFSPYAIVAEILPTSSWSRPIAGLFLLILMLVFLFHSRHREKDNAFLVRSCVIVCFLPLLSPLMWQHHLLLTFPALVLYPYLGSNRRRHICVLFALFLCFALSMNLLVFHWLVKGHSALSTIPRVFPSIALISLAFLISKPLNEESVEPCSDRTQL